MRPWWPLVAVCLGTFMLLVDVTIVNVALPPIAASLGTSFGALQWVIDGYALALAALLMVTGTLADRFGRRRLYVVGLVVFALASLACGLAPSAGALVAARVVQGVGGAAMFATTAAILATTYHGPRRGVAFGVWGAVNGLAAACGPLLGGLFTEAWGWRAIFLVNLPVAVVAVVLTLAVVTESASGGRARIDVVGAATFTLASAALVYGLVSAGEDGWGATTTVVALALAAAAVVAFVVVERRVEAPMLDLALFADPSFAALMVAATVLQAAAFSHLALVSLWLQSVLGLSPIRAGLVAVPLSIASFVVSVAAGRFLHGGAPARPIAGGLALIGVGVLLMTLVGPTSGPWALFAGLVVAGLGVGLATPVLVSATLSVLPAHRAGVGSAAVNTFRQLGLAVGLAVLGTIFAGRVAHVLAGSGVADPTGAANALAGGRAGQVPVASGTVHAAFASGLDTVFTVAGVAALVAALLVAVLVRPAPAAASAPTPRPVAARSS
ncbi:DHA2 family efflux MFS transporter permease subunit [Actinomycetospora endophytica]|uniref:DHA2 family efflux MFS transporter permease subunit n=1 Tax=Actinomycetospora endophytica TaxID=2291215 RepID=A0ABS8P840_9PSEU|nr:DHA2 family efflux MFS transporter permease subunit [Actinomycetospora endophytica]MCD2194423.1 DHA2 family efflux MFS transporter permease subunit [Actinomycetospora endophytica]